MRIQKFVSLAPYTTFKIGGPAKYFCVVKNIDEAKKAVLFAKEKNIPYFILGAGSNILVSDDGYEGLVIQIKNKGMEILKNPDKNYALINVASGENWDNFVKFSVANNLGGIENLSHIPGSTGAIAVQNVGAYGQEASNVITKVSVLNTFTLEKEEIVNKQCGFGYRTSIFNTSHKGQYIIFSIVFKLHKNGVPNISYRDLSIRFSGKKPTLEEVREAVINIRNKKFPFPKKAVNGNAGSFFKNLTLNNDSFLKLCNSVTEKFGETETNDLKKKVFTTPTGETKVPTAALIELCGLKHMQVGGAKINYNQPLVIVNETGKASAKDVLDLAVLMQKILFDTFNVKIDFEPCLLGFKKNDTLTTPHMKINIKATKTTLTPAIKAAVEKKLAILERFLRPENTVYVELEVDKKHKTGLVFRTEIKITPHSFFAEARGEDFYAALDLTLPKIKEQIVKYKDKKITKNRDAAKRIARIKKGI